MTGLIMLSPEGGLALAKVRGSSISGGKPPFVTERCLCQSSRFAGLFVQSRSVRIAFSYFKGKF